MFNKKSNAYKTAKSLQNCEILTKQRNPYNVLIGKQSLRKLEIYKYLGYLNELKSFHGELNVYVNQEINFTVHSKH